MSFLSPFNILFFLIIVGFVIGRIRVCRISLDIAGILFVSILAGMLMRLLLLDTHSEMLSDFQGIMDIFSKLGSSLFISVIGLWTGVSVKSNSKISLLAFIIGVIMSASGVAAMLLISKLDQTISYSTLMGVLCGALTSTPGLSSVYELAGVNREEAVWGYGCSYLLGVTLAVLFAQLLVQKKVRREDTRRMPVPSAGKKYSELMLISIIALFGNAISNIPNVFIGSTLSTLLIGAVVGYMVHNKFFASISISSVTLNAYKNLGLAIFFVGTGFTTGIRSINFDVRIIIYGALITLTAIICGLILCKVVLPCHRFDPGAIVAGGMTSSPAYGVISAQIEESDVNSFSSAYFGALVSLVIAIQIIGGL